MLVREYQISDCKEITELFYNTVHTVNAKDYTKEQLDVWATGQVDLEKWNQSLQEHYSIVVIENEVIVGFGDIDKTGCLDRLFVHADYQGKGIGKETIKRIIEYIKTFPYGTVEYIYASWHPENKASERLCLGSGFEVVGKDEDDGAIRSRLKI